VHPRTSEKTVFCNNDKSPLTNSNQQLKTFSSNQACRQIQIRSFTFFVYPTLLQFIDYFGRLQQPQKAMTATSIQQARKLFAAQSFGILSTISVKLNGFPFGSVTPYCIDGNGMAVVLISTIAQHTINIAKDNRCSITIIREGDAIQANARICVTGHMEPLADDETENKERYYANFPSSRSYHETHNFQFYRLQPISVRYIGGFGNIHWLEASDFNLDNPFHGAGENRVVSHMNEDHHKDLVRYCSHYKGLTISAEDVVRMAGIDSLGFDVFVNDKKIRFDFEQPISTAMEAREAMVALSRGAE
jgi:putative heme iron utilization protein